MIPVSRPSSPIWASTFVLMGMKQPEVIGKHRSGRGCVRVPLRDGVPGGGDSRHSGKAAGRVATFPCCDLLAGARPPPQPFCPTQQQKALPVHGDKRSASDCVAEQAMRHQQGCQTSLA